MRNSTSVYPHKIEYGEIFGLMFINIRSRRQYFFEIPLCEEKVIFVSEFISLGKNLHLCEVKKKAMGMEEKKSINFHYNF